MNNNLLTASNCEEDDQQNVLQNNQPISNYKGDTPLHIAASQGDDAQLLHLIECGFWVLNQSPSDGGSSLHWAAENGQIACCEILLEKGVHINIRDRNGNTPLHKAAQNEHYATINFLINKGALKKCHENCIRCAWANKRLGKWKWEQRMEKEWNAMIINTASQNQSQYLKKQSNQEKNQVENNKNPPTQPTDQQQKAATSSSSTSSDDQDSRGKLNKEIQQARAQVGDKIERQIKRKQEQKQSQSKRKGKKKKKKIEQLQISWNKNPQPKSSSTFFTMSEFKFSKKK